MSRAQKVLTSVWLIALVALGFRAGYAARQVHVTPARILRAVPFLYEPGNIAYSLAIGHGFGSPFREDTGPTAWEAPVYPALVATIFRMLGTYTLAAFLGTVAMNIAFSTLVCFPIYGAGKRIGGLSIGAAAAWFWAIFPNAVIVPFQWVWDTSLSALLAAAILWATLELPDSTRLRDWLLYGLLWGAALLTNPTLASVLPFLLGWLAWRSHQQGRAWAGRPGFSLFIMILCCLPWTVRNFVDFHAFVPVRSALGMELWLGNNEKYQSRWPVWVHPIDDSRERAKYVRMGEIAYMREKRQQAIEFILTHPAREVKMSARRFVAIWTGTATPVADFIEYRSFLVRSILVCNTLASLGALAGIALLFRKCNPYAIPVFIFPVIFPAVYYISLALLRYRYPIDPMVLLLDAIALKQCVIWSSLMRSEAA